MDNPRKALCLSGPFKSFMATLPREVACASGHVTGYFAGGSRERLDLSQLQAQYNLL